MHSTRNDHARRTAWHSFICSNRRAKTHAAESEKIESNLLKLKEFGYLNQRNKLATFCINTQPTYFMGILDADHFRDSLVAFDDSVDNFWADLLRFPDDFHRTNSDMYKSALQQLCLGIRDGGRWCYRNESF